MIAVIGLLVARVAFTVALVCTVAFHLRHREDRSTPQARRLRSIALWAIGVGVLGVVLYAVAE